MVLGALREADTNLPVANRVLTEVAVQDDNGGVRTGAATVAVQPNGERVVVDPDDGPRIAINLPVGPAASTTTLMPGVTSAKASEDLSYVPVVKSSGSVQIASVISSPSAPTDIVYELDVPSGTSLVQDDRGAVVLVDDQGAPFGSFEAPWAVDAGGERVSTRFEVRGTALVQVVEHRTADVQYPVVADPEYSWSIFNWAWLNYNSAYSSNQLSVSISAMGRFDLATNAGQFLVSGWNILNRDFNYYTSGRWHSTLYQQWECHVLGGMAEWGTYDLELNRPSNPNWRSRIGMSPLSATCNW